MGLGSGIRDRGSRIRKKPILDPGSGIPDLGVKKHWIPDPGSATLYLSVKICNSPNN